MDTFKSTGNPIHSSTGSIRGYTDAVGIGASILSMKLGSSIRRPDDKVSQHKHITTKTSYDTHDASGDDPSVSHSQEHPNDYNNSHHLDDKDDWNFSEDNQSEESAGAHHDITQGNSRNGLVDTPASQIARGSARMLGEDVEWNANMVMSSTPRHRHKKGIAQTPYTHKRFLSDDSIGDLIQQVDYVASSQNAKDNNDGDVDDDMPSLAELGIDVAGYQTDDEQLSSATNAQEVTKQVENLSSTFEKTSHSVDRKMEGLFFYFCVCFREICFSLEK